MAESGQVVYRGKLFDDGTMRQPARELLDLPPKNYTDPNYPMFVDIFKGKDDENYVFKSLLMSKFTGYTTAFVVLVDATVGTRPKDVPGFLRRVNYWAVPFIGGGLAYTSIVCTAASLRKKHDQYNHMLGGWAAGAVFGAARKSIFFGLVTGFATGLLAIYYKDSIMNDYEMFPTPRPRQQGLAFSHKWDFSMKPNDKGNWTRGPAPPAPES